VKDVVRSAFAGRRIVIFSGGEAKGNDAIYDEVRAIRDGGGLRLDHRPELLPAPEEGRARLPRHRHGHLRGQGEVAMPSFEVLSRGFLRVAEEPPSPPRGRWGTGSASTRPRRRGSDAEGDGPRAHARDHRDRRGRARRGADAVRRREGRPGPSRRHEIDIAVDPLEGTNLCATGAPGSIAVLAASTNNGLLHAPDCYMDKLVVGPAARDHVDLDAPVKDNLQTIAKCLNRDVEDLVVIVLDRERHVKLIDDIRTAGAAIKLIGDGDLSPAIAAAVRGTNVHAVMGIGGAPKACSRRRRCAASAAACAAGWSWRRKGRPSA
jgi:hypothetical protein